MRHIILAATALVMLGGSAFAESASGSGTSNSAARATANTMSACAEALGMTLPGESSAPAVSAERTDLARRTGEVVVRALAAGLRPRQIMTRTAFMNAAAVVMATAGSTNAVLHLLAIANEAGVELTMDDFDAVSRRTPVAHMVLAILRDYPRRALLGLVLMTAQAFFYNAIFFSYALVLTRFYAVPSASVGWYILPFALGNFLGPLLLGPLFDIVGRKPMIASTYAISGVLLAVVGYLFREGLLDAAQLTACV